MTGKVQGEGDYESARRYHQHTAESVKKRINKPKVEAEVSDEEMDAAEQAGRERAKEIGHDATDAKLMRNVEVDAQCR